MKTLREETGKELISAFVPSSPMPMTGYTVFIEADRVIPLPISIDEALRITMTGGVLIPPQEKVDDLFDELTARVAESSPELATNPDLSKEESA